MKNIRQFLVLILATVLWCTPALARDESESVISLSAAVINHSQRVHVEGVGNVMKILQDDNDGTRHQKFIIRTPEGASILIAHNIDIAGRIENLKRGDTVSFSGEYIWNEKGGVVHWTHHDPRGRHFSGWLTHKGVTYQ